MWILAPAAALVFALLLVIPSAAPAKASYDPRTTALRTVRLGVSYAMTLETNALKLARAGNEAGAKSEIQNALHLLDQVLPSAQSLTPPTDLNHYAPDDPWHNLTPNLRTVMMDDEDALHSKGYALLYNLTHAEPFKKAIYKLLDNEIRYPMCTEAVNVQSVSVNGVTQGNPQFSVGVVCNMPVQSVYVVLPNEAITNLAPDGSAKAAIAIAANAIKVVMAGATDGGATGELPQTPPADAPVDSVVVPIAGDSHDEYFDEVM